MLDRGPFEAEARRRLGEPPVTEERLAALKKEVASADHLSGRWFLWSLGSWAAVTGLGWIVDALPGAAGDVLAGVADRVWSFAAWVVIPLQVLLIVAASYVFFVAGPRAARQLSQARQEHEEYWGRHSRLCRELAQEYAIRYPASNFHGEDGPCSGCAELGGRLNAMLREVKGAEKHIASLKWRVSPENWRVIVALDEILGLCGSMKQSLAELAGAEAPLEGE